MRIKKYLVFILLLLAKFSPGQTFTAYYPKTGQFVSGEVDFAWNTADSASQYRFKLGTNNQLTQLNIDQFTTSNNFSLSNLSNGLYFWKVIAYKGSIPTDSTRAYRFNCFSVAQLDSVNLWLRSDTGLVLNGNTVATWNDLSDSSLNLNQVTAARQPLFSNSVLNGYPGVFFDGVNDYFDFPINLTRSNYSFASVYNTRVKSGLIRFFNGSNSWFYGPYAGKHAAFSGGFTQGKVVDSARFVVHSVRVANDQLYNFVNDSLYGQKLATTRPGISLRMGSFLSGYALEVVIINGLIADSTRKKIDKYLLDKYAPPVDLGADQLVCSFPINLNASKDYIESYLWSTGATSSSISVSASGTYSLRTVDKFGRVSRDTVIITKDTVNYNTILPADTTLCVGDSIRIEVAGSDLYTYQWSTGEIGKSLWIDSAGMYKLTVSDCNGNVTSDSIQVNFNNPIFSLGPDQQICFYDSLLVTPDSSFSGVSYLWSTGSTQSAVQLKNSGIYSLTVTDAYSCSFADSINLFSDSTLFDISLGPDTSLCSGNSLGLINPIPFIDNYLWSTGSTDSSIVLLNSQNYSLTVTENGCSNSDTVQITVKGQAPEVGFSRSNLCFGDSVQFTDTSVASGGINLKSWLWNFGDGASSTLQNPKHKYASSGIYTVSLQVENDSGCIGEVQIPINIRPKPQANFSFSLACELDSTLFTNNSSISSGSISSYRWDFGNLAVNGDTSILTNPAYVYPDTGLYNVQLISTSNFGCSDTLIQQVDVKAKPTADFSASSFYIGDSTEFSNQSSISSGTISTYLWQFGDGNNSNLTDPKHLYAAKGPYQVSLQATSNFGCVDIKTDSIRITDPPPPKPEFNTVYPKFGQVLSEAVLFRWNERDSSIQYKLEIAEDTGFTNMVSSTSAILRNFKSQSLPSGSYYWRVIASLAGQKRDTTNRSEFKIFSPRDLPQLNLWIKSDTGLGISNGTINSWLDLSDSAIQIVQSATVRQPVLQAEVINSYPGVYFDGTNDLFNFPIELDKANFSISSVYNTNTKAGLISYIRGSNNWFMGPYAGKHVVFSGGFTDGEIVDSARFAVHRVSAKSDTLYNHVNGVFFASRPASNRPGTSLTLGSFLSGHVLETMVVQGNLSDSLKSLCDEYLMDKYAPPLDLGPDVRSCSFPMQFQKSLDYAVSYNWSTGSNNSLTTIDSAGKYYLTIVDQFNRQSTDSIFFILDTSNYQANFGFDDTTICKGSSIELYAGNSIYDFSWNTSDTSYSIQVDSAGLYKVSVLNCQGNWSEDSVMLYVNEPRFSLGADTSICFNRNIVLKTDSNFSQVSYLWSTGSTDSSLLVNLEGTYALQVTDNYGCTYADSLILQVDSSLAVLDLGPDTSLCRGNTLGLQVHIPGISAYNWSNGFIGPRLPLDSAGIYAIEVLKDGCAARDTVVLTIQGDAPFANFASANFCFLDSMQFTDLSSPPTGDTLVSWLWLFGDGDSSQMSATKHQYPQAGNFLVNLKVTTNRGCSDTTQQQITINPKPNANFQSTNKCSKSAISFFDRSTVSSGSILAYSWNFGDSLSSSNSSSLQKPNHIYDTLGLYPVQLIAISDKGCRDTIVKNKLVNPSPIVDYNVINSCFGDTSLFKDQSSLAAGSIFDYRWVINNNFISLKNEFEYKAAMAGNLPISLRVRSDSLCSVELLDTIPIYHKPTADFIKEDFCVDQQFLIQNNSSVLEDSIVSYRYIFGGTDTSYLANPNFIRTTSGSFPLRLKVETNRSCVDSVQKELLLVDLPVPQFQILNNNTGIPFELSVVNLSSGANNYVWSFGNGDQSSDVLPNYTYLDTGRYSLKLKAINQAGCADSLSKMVRALPYFLDATISKAFLSETVDGYLEVAVQLANVGNNTIEQISLAASINDKFSIQENYVGEIFSGKQEAFEFAGSFIQGERDKVDFVCIRILSVNGVKDDVLLNNEYCERGFTEELFLEFYPNPVNNQLNVNYVLPDRGEVSIEIFDQLGRPVQADFNQFQEAGVYNMILNTSSLKAGLYHYRFSFNGKTRTETFIKQ